MAGICPRQLPLATGSPLWRLSARHTPSWWKLMAVQLPKGVLATAPPDWREGVAALEAAATMPGAGAATRPELMETAAQLRATHGMPSASTCADWRLPLEALAKLIARLENGAEDEVAQPEPAPGGLTRVIARCRLTDGRQNV